MVLVYGALILSKIMPHPSRVLQKYTSFGEPDTHQSTCLKSPSNIGVGYKDQDYPTILSTSLSSLFLVFIFVSTLQKENNSTMFGIFLQYLLDLLDHASNCEGNIGELAAQ
ncbi:hypothetical protein H5410_044761 [Solanum commersonii]|uniref:Uncharacterized protein n=1 Tax=Solanum commersonii TaxID=4109 RepID=A0A9J5X9I3_SOLCO|nr:hypothetical protein H5410_044761 [Solanum commersonii]